MSHDEPLPECKVNWKEVEKHHNESVGVRSMVDVSHQQILTLEKAHEATMNDIRDIKESVSRLERTVLYSAISGLIILLGSSIYFGSKMYQLDSVTERINTLEEMHPRVGK